jgi:hypothetical protein
MPPTVCPIANKANYDCVVQILKHTFDMQSESELGRVNQLTNFTDQNIKRYKNYQCLFIFSGRRIADSWTDKCLVNIRAA